MNNHLLKIGIALIIMVMLSSCGLFRRKNRCMDCPKWSLEQQAQSKDNSIKA